MKGFKPAGLAGLALFDALQTFAQHFAGVLEPARLSQFGDDFLVVVGQYSLGVGISFTDVVTTEA